MSAVFARGSPPAEHRVIYGTTVHASCSHMDHPIFHGVDNNFQLLRCEPFYALRYKPHACLCIEPPHLTRRLLVAFATRTNIKADSFSLCVPRLGKSLTGCEKGLRVYDRAASPLGRRQVNGHCLQGGFIEVASAGKDSSYGREVWQPTHVQGALLEDLLPSRPDRRSSWHQ